MSRVALPKCCPLLFVLALGLPAAAGATPPPVDQAAWRLSLHFGAGNLDVDGDPLQRDFGGSVQARVGYIVAPNVIAGLQVRSWSGSESGLARSVRLYTLTTSRYFAGRGFYVRAGGGTAAVAQEVNVRTASGSQVKLKQENGGFAASGATGYEFRLRETIGLGVDVEYAWLSAGGFGGSFVNYTAGLSWFW